MKEFIECLSQFSILNQQQIELITKRAKILELRKGEYFSEAGKIPQQVGFMLQGIIRICYNNNRGEEITRYFIEENNFVVDMNSFLNKIPSTKYVQAITDCTLIVFAKNDWNELTNTIVGWDSAVHKIISKALLQKVEIISSFISEDATTRYLTFMEKYPQLANRIPLSCLASYLGITQSSLSRIRKNIR